MRNVDESERIGCEVCRQIESEREARRALTLTIIVAKRSPVLASASNDLLGQIFEQPRKVVANSFKLVEALVDMLFKFATLFVLALAIEPNASLANI